MLARFIEHTTNEDVQTRLEDYETEVTFANGNSKDDYVMLSRLYNIHVQGSRSKVYVIQQWLNKATLKEYNNEISEFNKWFKAKNRAITKATLKNTMQVQQLFQTYLTSSCKAFVRKIKDEQKLWDRGIDYNSVQLMDIAQSNYDTLTIEGK